MNTQYIEVRVNAQVDATELAGMLNQHALIGVWDAGCVIHLYWDLDLWTDSIATVIEKSIQQLGGEITRGQMEVLQIPWQDWNAEWTALVKPIRIGRRILIRPSWEEAILPENGIELILDPKQAFGTGHHVTTQLLIEWLEEIIQGNERILDVGTGTGILAMVALRLGAKCALGIDQDPVAIECARDYAVTNGLGSHCELQHSTLNELYPVPFDVVLANLDRQTFLSCRREFKKFQYDGTTLLLSGILREDREEISDSFRNGGWSVEEIRERDSWLGVRLKG